MTENTEEGGAPRLHGSTKSSTGASLACEFSEGRTAFTGRRRIGPLEVDLICRVVSEEIEFHAPGRFLFGGAEGADTASLIAAARINRSLLPEKRAKLVVIVPGRLTDQPDEARSAVVDHADVIHQLGLPIRFASSYRTRNCNLVERADRVVAFWDGVEAGGTFMTIQIARKKGRQLRIVRLDRPEGGQA